ncbi:TAXI family TRAP transporter solute-binding subunit [Pokkaliibacter sp. CJK22405]|uniref:TAXI family TRAP transporter solute-binding subunit n=1 Tax=Pokkaliibacter sp. CJK22405 TaxID=3384615 RepID=UPI0039856602
MYCRNKLLSALLLGGLSLSGITAFADDTTTTNAPAATAEKGVKQHIVVGTGSESGNYFSMGKDIKSYCEDSLSNGSTLEIAKSDGSIDNIIGMNEKRYSAAIVQEDVMQYFAKTEPRKVNKNRMKVIAGLHMESAHLLIPINYKPDSNEGFGDMLTSLFDGQSTAPLSLDALQNQTIGSWGGSMVSAKALSYFLHLNLKVQDIPAGKRSDPGIPVLLIGGHPYAPVQQILDTGKYRLVAINFDKLKEKAPFYLKSSVSYKVKGKVETVQTFAVRAMLVGKSFRKESRNVNMSLLANCITDNLADLADDSETNPNWGSVYDLEQDNDQSSWAYFPL